jgi:hypothetical protein
VRNFRGLKEIRFLGKGSSGTVKLVVNESPHEQIALKAFPVGGQDVCERFFREIELPIRLSHFWLLRIVGYFLATGKCRAQIECPAFETVMKKGLFRKKPVWKPAMKKRKDLRGHKLIVPDGIIAHLTRECGGNMHGGHVSMSSRGRSRRRDKAQVLLQRMPLI